jgi:NAD(P)-dependent dehydrogenase (short-subunit alcohol dehydrogenase family)
MKEFRGKVAVITGGASGIGRAMADRFAREGMKIVLADRDEAALDRAVAELAAAGAEAAGVVANVASAAEVEGIAAKALLRFGAVHVVCNNAGVGGPLKPSWELTDAEWSHVFGPNVWGVVHGIRTFVPLLLRQETEGHIVNTASLAGLLSLPFGAAYHASKHAVVTITESLHYELSIRNAPVKASVLCPGFVNTRIFESTPEAEGAARSPEQARIEANFQERIRAGLDPAEVAGMVLEAIREERFYILTHPQWNASVLRRAEDIIAGRNPDVAQAVGKLLAD